MKWLEQNELQSDEKKSDLPLPRPYILTTTAASSLNIIATNKVATITAKNSKTERNRKRHLAPISQDGFKKNKNSPIKNQIK